MAGAALPPGGLRGAPAADPAPAGPVEAPAAEENEQPDEPQTFRFEGLGTESLDSYVADVGIQFDGSDRAGAPVRVDQAFTLQARRDPALLALDFEKVDFENVGLERLPVNPGALSELSAFVTPDSVALDLGLLCFALPVEQGGLSAEDAFAALMLDPNDLAQPGASPPELTLVGAEMVGGQRALHYRGAGMDLQNFEDATLDVWVAEAGHIVRIEATGAVPVERFRVGNATEGELRLQYEVTGVNEPIEVTPPTNCQPLALPELAG